jgi:type IV pilus assembly protein PilC
VSWVFYSFMDRDGALQRRSGRFASVDFLDAELARRGEQMVDFYELPEVLYNIKQMAVGTLKPLEVAEFCSTLSMYVSGGVDLQSALYEMEKSARSFAFRIVNSDLRQALLNGYPLSRAMTETGQFPDEVIALTKIGEESGTLDRVLQDAGEHIERVEAIKSAAKRAMIYPAFTLTVVVAGAIFWLSFVVPKIAEVFKSINLDLPPMTLALVGASDWVREFWWLLILIFIAMPMIFFAARRNERFRYLTDKAAWYMPVMGRIVRGSQMAFYYQYFGLMYGAGVAITQALETVNQSLKNRFFRQRVSGVLNNLKSGDPLVRSLDRTGIFEPIGVRMLGIGEETGRLEEQLKKLAQIYFSRVNALVDILGKVLEPLLIIFMAGIFGFFIMAVIGPIYESIGKLGAQ